MFYLKNLLLVILLNCLLLPVMAQSVKPKAEATQISNCQAIEFVNSKA